MQLEQAHAIATVRALKGPPLTIFITMRVVRRPTTQRRLCALTGCARKTH